MEKPVTVRLLHSTLNSVLNEALVRQTVMIFDRMDQRFAEQTEYILSEVDKRFEAHTIDITDQLVDMMAHIDNRFNKLEAIVTGTVKRVDNHEGRISKLEGVASL